MFDRNWFAVSHQDIAAEIAGGSDGGFSGAGGSWQQLSGRLLDVTGAVRRATSTISVTRSGAAAEAAHGATAPLDGWLQRAESLAGGVGSASYEQARDLAGLVRTMPPPHPRATLPTDWMSVLAHSQPGESQSQLNSVEKADRSRLDAERQAQQLMSAYQRTSSLRTDALPRFGPPDVPVGAGPAGVPAVPVGPAPDARRPAGGGRGPGRPGPGGAGGAGGPEPAGPDGSRPAGPGAAGGAGSAPGSDGSGTGGPGASGPGGPGASRPGGAGGPGPGGAGPGSGSGPPGASGASGAPPAAAVPTPEAGAVPPPGDVGAGGQDLLGAGPPPGTGSPGTVSPGSAASGTVPPGAVPPGVLPPGSALSPGATSGRTVPHPPGRPGSELVPARWPGTASGSPSGSPTSDGPRSASPTGAGDVGGGGERLLPGAVVGRGPGGSGVEPGAPFSTTEPGPGARVGSGGPILEPAVGRPGGATGPGGAHDSGVPLVPAGMGTGTAPDGGMHRRPGYLCEDDPDAIAGVLPRVAPPVIGE